MTVKALIFDMDGLMFDSEAIYCVAFMNAAKEFGMSFTREDYLSLVGKSEEQTEQYLQSLYERSTATTDDVNIAGSYHHDAFVDTWLHHWRHMTTDKPIPIKPGLLNLLDWASDVDLPCAIATGSGREQLDLYLGQSGLADRFSATVTRESVTRGKPAPDPYILAARSLDIDPVHCVAFEDSNTGCASAVAAGMRVIVVPDMVAADTATQANASAIVKDLLVAHQQVMAWHD